MTQIVTFCGRFYANAIVIHFDLADITSSTGEGLQQPRGKNFFHSEANQEIINGFLQSMMLPLNDSLIARSNSLTCIFHLLHKEYSMSCLSSLMMLMMTKSKRQVAVKTSCMINTALNSGQKSKREYLLVPRVPIPLIRISFRGTCAGLIVEGGYMFKMDPDMSSFPVITWHCPKLRSSPVTNFCFLFGTCLLYIFI